MSDRPRGPVAALARTLALAGGAMLLAVSGLTCWSVTQRWFTSQPVPGDFELVSIGAGVAVFGCLAYGTLLRADIVVDSFTGWLPPRLRRGIDAAWSLVWAAAAAVLAERLLVGARETLRTSTTTMVLGLPTWWAVGLGAVGFAATAVAALHGTARLLRGEDR